jgi:hypothetical protein
LWLLLLLLLLLLRDPVKPNILFLGPQLRLAVRKCAPIAEGAATRLFLSTFLLCWRCVSKKLTQSRFVQRCLDFTASFHSVGSIVSRLGHWQKKKKNKLFFWFVVRVITFLSFLFF